MGPVSQYSFVAALLGVKQSLALVWIDAVGSSLRWGSQFDTNLAPHWPPFPCNDACGMPDPQF